MFFYISFIAWKESILVDMRLGRLASGSVTLSKHHQHILYSLPLVKIPLIFESSLIFWASSSIKSAKRIGLSGHPCWHPRSSRTVPERTPFILIRATSKLYIDFRQLIIVLLIPKCCKTSYKYSSVRNWKVFQRWN